jgi:hypothetical protein
VKTNQNNAVQQGGVGEPAVVVSFSENSGPVTLQKIRKTFLPFA